MRRSVLVAALAFGLGSLSLPIACSSFGTSADPGAPADGGTESTTLDPVDATGADGADGSVADGGAPRFCDDKKSFVICSDFEQPLSDPNRLLDRGWDSVDNGVDLVIDPRDGTSGHALHVKVPGPAAGVTKSQALRKVLPSVPSELTLGVSMRAAPIADTQYTELVSLETKSDARDLQIVLEMTDGNLSLTESSLDPDGGAKVELPLFKFGTLGVNWTRLEVKLWFGQTNEVQLAIDGVVAVQRTVLPTMQGLAPKPPLTLLAGYPITIGSAAQHGGGYFLDDITLETKP
jgi:hypothetical protein